MKKRAMSIIMLIAMVAYTAPLNADCNMTGAPGTNGWCAGITNEEGEVVDYYCQDEEPWKYPNGTNFPTHCIIIPT